MDCFLKRNHRHLAVFDTAELAVVEIGRDGRQDFFDAPTAFLARMIIVLGDDR